MANKKPGGQCCLEGDFVWGEQMIHKISFLKCYFADFVPNLFILLSWRASNLGASSATML